MLVNYWLDINLYRNKFQLDYQREGDLGKNVKTSLLKGGLNEEKRRNIYRLSCSILAQCRNIDDRLQL